MRRCVCWLALAAPAAGYAPWDSSQAKELLSTSEREQAVKTGKLNDVRREASALDEMLDAHRKILSIQRDELEKAQRKLEHAQQEKRNLSHWLEHAKEWKADDFAEANRTQMAEEYAVHHLKEAQEWLSKAQSNASSAHQAWDAADSAYTQAYNKLLYTAIHHPNHLLTAVKEERQKAWELKEANRASDKAEEVATHAVEEVKAADAAREEATEARERAAQKCATWSGKIKEKNQSFTELTQKWGETLGLEHELNQAVANQRTVVEKLRGNSTELHKMLGWHQSIVKGGAKEVEKLQSCVSRLAASEANLTDLVQQWVVNTRAYKRTRGSEEHMELKGVLVGVMYYTKSALSELRSVQSECAPANVSVPVTKLPEVCQWQTGGTCQIFRCYDSRGPFVVCNDQHKCVCSPGSCAQHGICIDQGDPLKDAIMQTLIPKQQWQQLVEMGEAEASEAEPRLRADRSALVFASAALTMAAALAAGVLRSRRSREVQLSQGLLG